MKGYFKDYTLTIADVDMHNRILPSSILNIFQDIATENADILGVGREILNKDNSFWILSRVSYHINKPFAYFEKIKARTWVSSVKTIYSDRDYALYNETGDQIVTGSSRWCIVDKNNKSIKKINVTFPEDILINEKYIETVKIDQLLYTPDKSLTYKIRPSDIDVNLHMNNTKYADMAFNAFSMEEHAQKFISEFHINYICEMKNGETVTINRWDTENGVVVEGGSNGSPAFRIILKTSDYNV